jgi:hypothetical protein
VFRAKFEILKGKLLSGAVFEQPAVYLQSVIEFQKRGLPHAHIALRVQGPQPTTAGMVDTYVSAEVPEGTSPDGMQLRHLAGRGKTFLLRAIANMLRAASLDAIVIAAYTGIVASDHDGARTMHKTFGLPLHVGLDVNADTLQSSVTMQSKEAQALRAAKVVVLDELPMCHGAYLHVVDALLRDVMAGSAPFSGKVVVAAGDFRQTCPVVPRATRDQVLQACVKASPLWAHFRVLHLTVPVRAAEDPEFAAFLETVGNGVALHVDAVTGQELPDQAKRQRCGGTHYVRLPAILTARIRVFTDAAEAAEFVHPAGRLQSRDYATKAPSAPSSVPTTPAWTTTTPCSCAACPVRRIACTPRSTCRATRKPRPTSCPRTSWRTSTRAASPRTCWSSRWAPSSSRCGTFRSVSGC